MKRNSPWENVVMASQFVGDEVTNRLEKHSSRRALLPNWENTNVLCSLRSLRLKIMHGSRR
jgi:hypothetical protein